MRGDDPQAVECMIRYIYVSDYDIRSIADNSKECLPDWIQHYNTAVVADKYDLPILKSKAFACFRTCAEQLTDTNEIFDVMIKGMDYHDTNEDMAKLLSKLRDDHATALIKHEGFREVPQEDDESAKDFCIKHYSKLKSMLEFRELLKHNRSLALGLLDSFDWAIGLTKKDISRCQGCSREVAHVAGMQLACCEKRHELYESSRKDLLVVRSYWEQSTMTA